MEWIYFDREDSKWNYTNWPFIKQAKWLKKSK
jgi:hypothetical protein